MEFPLENLLNKNTAHTNISASLSIMGEYFDVQKITDALEVTPSCTWNKGEFIRDSGKSVHIQHGSIKQKLLKLWI